MKRWIPVAVGGVGAALAIAGVAIFWRTNVAASMLHGSASYAPLEAEGSGSRAGWFAYSGGRIVVGWTAGHLIGAGLLLLGLLALSGVGGWWLGRRSARR